MAHGQRDTGIYRFEPERVPTESTIYAHLSNTQWGTNFPQWLEGSFSWRIRLVPHEGDWRSGQSWNMPTYEQFFAPRVRERHLRRVEQLKPIADRLGTTVASLALRWVIEQEGVTAAIAGSRNARHTQSNAEAGTLKLDEITLEEIDRIFS